MVMWVFLGIYLRMANACFSVVLIVKFIGLEPAGRERTSSEFGWQIKRERYVCVFVCVYLHTCVCYTIAPSLCVCV